MPTILSTGIGGTPSGVSINSDRRLFNFGDRIAELAPQESAFLSMIQRYAKAPTDDPVFKFMEQRHQWQRRTFNVQVAKAAATVANTITSLSLGCKYDKYGKQTTAYQPPQYLLPGQVLEVKVKAGPSGSLVDTFATLRVTSLGTATANAQPVDVAVVAIAGNGDYVATNPTHQIQFVLDDPGRVIGSAFAEGTGAPDGWMDALSTAEGYTQIFKTAISLFSGSSMATRYRGVSNEYTRVWAEKLKEHKMDICQATLYGVGRYEVEDGTNAKRYTWGIVPFTERFGKVYSIGYAASNPYDKILDALEDFMAPESGNSRDKLVLTSRKVLAWLNKIGTGNFLGNTVGASSYRFDIQNVKGEMGHEVTKVRTIFGNLHFVEEPTFRAGRENMALMVDLNNVKYRPLVGNGISRDTFIQTNVQNNDVDGRKDMITTEAGLEISLPETHGILTF